MEVRGAATRCQEIDLHLHHVVGSPLPHGRKVTVEIGETKFGSLLSSDGHSDELWLVEIE